ncbi:MAG: HAD family hydrolase [Dehalococcoidia bacterium]
MTSEIRSTDDRAVSALLFEPYGVLLDIETDERDWYAYLHLSRFLEYRGVRLSADELRWLWFEGAAAQTQRPEESYPDIAARRIWQQVLEGRMAHCAWPGDLDPVTLVADVTVLHRALTRRTLRLMDGARAMLEALSPHVRLGIVTDSQPEYILPELRTTGIGGYFRVVVVSGAHGYRKPDPRLFRRALADLAAPAEEALFVGVDTGRDITGAAAVGMRTALALTPYGSKDIALGEPDFVVDSPEDLLSLPGLAHLT